MQSSDSTKPITILWHTNLLPPEAEKELHIPVSIGGSWIIGMRDALQRSDCNIRLYIVAPYYDLDETLYCELYNVGYFAVPVGDTVTAYPWILKDIRPDIVHIHGTERYEALAMLKLCDKTRVVVAIQGLMHELCRHYYKGISAKFADIRDEKREFLYKNGYSVMANSAVAFKAACIYETEILCSVSHIIGRTTWDKEQTAAINPNREYHHVNEILRTPFYSGEKWQLKNCRPHSIFISQIHYPIKGAHIFFESLSDVVKKYPDTTVRIAGNPPKRAKLPAALFVKYELQYANYIEKMIKKYHLKKYVSYTGPLFAEDVKAELLQSHIFVCCSSIENESNSLSEAKILGVPSIVSQVGGMCDRIADGEDGFFYEFIDETGLTQKIRRLFGDKQLCRNISQNAIINQTVINDVDINTSALLNVYDKLLSTPIAPKTPLIQVEKPTDIAQDKLGNSKTSAKRLLFYIFDYYPFETANTNVLQPLLQELQKDYDIDVLTHTVKTSVQRAEVVDGINVFRYRPPFRPHPEKLARAIDLIKQLLRALFIKDEDTVSPRFKGIKQKIIRFYKKIANRRWVFSFASCNSDFECMEWLCNSANYAAVITATSPLVTQYPARELFRRGFFAKKNIAWFPFFSDPCATFIGMLNKPIHKKLLYDEASFYEGATAVFVAPELAKDNQNNLLSIFGNKTIPIQHASLLPLIQTAGAIKKKAGRIACLYTGSLFDNAVRKPEYFFKLARALPQFDFHIVCNVICPESLKQKKDLLTGIDNIFWYNRKSHRECINFICDSDILINLGNLCENQTPSKIFEYIASGKPIVNFCGIKNDTAAQYLKPYPFHINISEYDTSLTDAVSIFADFCNSHYGRSIQYGEIEQLYSEHTAQNTAKFFAYTLDNLLR